MHHNTTTDYLISTVGSLALNLSLQSEKSITCTPLSLRTRTETLNRVAPPAQDACNTDRINTDSAKQVQMRIPTLVST